MASNIAGWFKHDWRRNTGTVDMMTDMDTEAMTLQRVKYTIMKLIDFGATSILR